MVKEIEKPFGVEYKPHDETAYAEAKNLWETGNMSSDAFFQMAINKLVSTHHLFESWETTLNDLPPEEVLRQLAKSEILKDAGQRGYGAEEPPANLIRHANIYFYKYKETHGLENYLMQRSGKKKPIESLEFEQIDESLTASLPLNLYLAAKNRKYSRRHSDGTYLTKFANTVKESIQNEDEAENILIWLHYKGLVSAIDRYKVEAILRLTDESRGQITFRNYDHLAESLSPMAYFSGWNLRLEKKNSMLEEKLPAKFAPRMARTALLAANFYHERSERKVDRFDLLSNALRSIEASGNTDEIRGYYATLQAEAIRDERRRPFKVWDVENLKLKPLIEAELSKLGVTEVSVPEIKQPEVPTVIEFPTKAKSEERKAKTKTVTRKKEQEQKSAVQILKEELGNKKNWSSTDLNTYMYALAADGREALMPKSKLPTEITLPDSVSQTTINMVTNIRLDTYPHIIRNDDNGHLLIDIPADRPVTITELKKGTVARILRKNFSTIAHDDQPVLPLNSVFEFLQEKAELPIDISATRDNNYLLLRAADTINLTEESGFTFERFRDYWYKQSGLVLPTTWFGRMFNYEGVSWVSPSTNRRPATIEACRSHNLALYESGDKFRFTKIA